MCISCILALLYRHQCFEAYKIGQKTQLWKKRTIHALKKTETREHFISFIHKFFLVKKNDYVEKRK